MEINSSVIMGVDTKEDLIDLVIEKDNIIDNLQSKIDKAIEYIKTEASYSTFRNMCEGMLNYEKVNELLDILKEDKNVKTK